MGTIPIEGDQIVETVNDTKKRKAWLKGEVPALRQAIEDAFVAGKSMELKRKGYARLRYKWLSSVVELRVDEKPGGKSSIVADSSNLPDVDAVAVRRAAFVQALDRLRELALAVR